MMPRIPRQAAHLMLLFFTLAALAASLACSVSAQAVPTYSVQVIGGGTARAINDVGQIVGQNTANHAFLWSAGSGMLDLGLCPPPYNNYVATIGLAINNAGQIVGDTWDNGEWHTNTFLWTSTSGMQNGPGNDATGINDAGIISGFDNGDGRAATWSTSNGFQEQDLGYLGSGPWSGANAINSMGQVVGWSWVNGPNNYHAFLWTPGPGMQDLGTLAGDDFSHGLGINANGSVVGWSESGFNSGHYHAFLWTATSGMIPLGVLSGDVYSQANGINSTGVVVGNSWDAGGHTHAFFWTNQSGMRALPPPAGAVSYCANGINAAGQIVGNACDSNGNSTAILWNPVSIPALTLSKSVNLTSAATGSAVLYTLAYANNGSGSATNVSITDALPAGVNYFPGSGGSNATYDAPSNTITWSIGALAAGGSGQVTFQAVVAATAMVGSSINNQADIACTEVPAPVVSNAASFTVIASKRGDWWMFQHDVQHSGRSPFTGPSMPQVKWTFATGGAVYACPAIAADGSLYLSSSDGYLYALSSNGTQNWLSQLMVGANMWGGRDNSSPAIETDGTIYVGNVVDPAATLFAFNPNSTPKWTFAPGAEAVNNGSPTIGVDGTIYLGAPWPLYGIMAVNPNASQKWFTGTGGEVYCSPALGTDGTIYAVCNDNNLYALNPDGSQKWTFDLHAALWGQAPVVGPDGTIYVGSGKPLYAINPNGSQKWACDLGTGNDSVAVAVGTDSTVYVGGDDHYLYAIDTKGAIKWSFKAGDIFNSSPAIGGDGTIYAGSNDKNFYAINADGSLKWKVTTGGNINSSVAIGVDGMVYFGCDDGKLYAIGQAPPLTTVTLTPNPASPQPVNTPITLTATTTGGVNMVYQFLANGMVVRDYTASSTCTWTPASDGLYQLTVNARDLYGADPTQVYSSAPVSYTILPVAVADAYAVNAGATLTVTTANSLLVNDLGSPTLTVAGHTNPAHGTLLTIAANGTFSYQPAAGFYGMDTFTYTASDGALTSVPATVTITVSSIPLATNDAYTVYAGSTLTVAAPGVLANDSNADGNPLSARLSTGVANGSLKFNADGSFSYTPKTGFSGRDSFTYRALNGTALSNASTVTITVKSIPLATNDAYTVYAGSTLTVAAPGVLANDTNADGNPITAKLSTGAANGSLKFNADGSFNYTPKAGFFGTDAFTYRATDGTAVSNAATVTITVNAIPTPSITSITPSSGTTGTVVTITGTNFTGATAVAFGGTAAKAFTVTNATTISATVGSGTTGTITVTTPGGMATSSAIFTVYSTPVATPDVYSVFAGSTLSIAAPGVLANDTNGDGNPLSAKQSTGVANGTLKFNADGSFSYTPKAGFTGTDAFTYRAVNGTAQSAAATVTITVNAVPPPTITSFTPSSGVTGTVVTITGTNFTGATAVAFGGTAAKAFTVTNATTISATVGSGTTGTITVTTPGGKAISSISFTFYSTPVATPDAYPVFAGSTLSIAASGVLANDTNADGNPITAKLSTGVANGSLKFNADGSFSYTPKAGFTGTDSFTYRAVNGTVQSAAATVTITVYAIPSPIAVNVTASPASPQPVNTQITFTATSTGVADAQYMFWVFNLNTLTWSQVQAYSTSATCAWTSATSGNYLICVFAQDGITGATVNTTIWYTLQ